VAGGALKLTAANTMAHRSFLSFVGEPFQVLPATQHFGWLRKTQIQVSGGLKRKSPL